MKVPHWSFEDSASRSIFELNSTLVAVTSPPRFVVSEFGEYSFDHGTHPRYALILKAILLGAVAHIINLQHAVEVCSTL